MGSSDSTGLGNQSGQSFWQRPWALPVRTAGPIESNSGAPNFFQIPGFRQHPCGNDVLWSFKPTGGSIFRLRQQQLGQYGWNRNGGQPSREDLIGSQSQPLNIVRGMKNSPCFQLPVSCSFDMDFRLRWGASRGFALLEPGWPTARGRQSVQPLRPPCAPHLLQGA